MSIAEPLVPHRWIERISSAFRNPIAPQVSISGAIGSYWTHALVAVMLIAAFDLAIVRYYLPPTEGWWVIYAWAMTRGLKLYQDIYLALPPLHALIMRMGWQLTGETFLGARLFGVVLHCAASLAMFAWLERIFGLAGAFWGTFVVSVWIISSNGAYVSGDYHETGFLFIALAMFTSTFITEAKSSSQRLFLTFTLGVLCGFQLLIKQNAGVFFTIGESFFLAAEAIDRAQWNFAVASKQNVLPAAAFVFGIAVPLFAITAALGPEWVSSYIDANSKGSAQTVLRRFWTDTITHRILMLGLLFSLAATWPSPWQIFQKMTNYREKFTFDFPGKKRVILVLQILICCSVLNRYGTGETNNYMALSIAGVGITAILAINNQYSLLRWHKFGFILIGAIVYAHSMTATLNPVSVECSIAFSVALIAWHLPRWVLYRPIFSFIFATAVLVYSVQGKTSGLMYNWWGLARGGIASATLPLPFPELAGFRVDGETARFINMIYEYKRNLPPQTVVFSYPSIPLLYVLLDKKPYANIPIMWFDVTDGSMAPAVLAKLTVDPPDVIFWLYPPYAVYEGHAALRQRTSLMYFIDNWLFDALNSGQYVVDRTLIMPPNFGGPPLDLRVERSAEIYVTRDSLTCPDFQWEVTAVAGTRKCLNGSTIHKGETARFHFGDDYLMQKALDSGIGIVTDRAYMQHQFIVLKKAKPKQG